MKKRDKDKKYEYTSLCASGKAVGKNGASTEKPIASVFNIGDEGSYIAMEEASSKKSAATISNTASSTSSSSSLRRLACDACRVRKVRCDRQDPPCSRCAKQGVTCRYSGRSNPTSSKTDISKFLETLNSRLSECCTAVVLACIRMVANA